MSYVGQTVQALSKRIGAHRCRSRCYAIGAAIKKYGLKNFLVEVLLDDVPVDELDEMEDQCIMKHNTLKPHGYNLVRGRPELGKGLRYKKFSEIAKLFANTESFKQKKRDLWKDPDWAAAWRETWMEKRKEKLDGLDGRERELRLLGDKRNDRVVAKRKAIKGGKFNEWDQKHSHTAVMKRRHIKNFNERLEKIKLMTDKEALHFLRKARRQIQNRSARGKAMSLEEINKWYPFVATEQCVQVVRARGLEMLAELSLP